MRPLSRRIAPHYSSSALRGELKLGVKDVFNSTDTHVAVQVAGVGMGAGRDLQSRSSPHAPSRVAPENQPLQRHHALGPSVVSGASHSSLMK